MYSKEKFNLIENSEVDLETVILAAKRFIDRSYMDTLENNRVEELTQERIRSRFTEAIQIKKIVYDKDEDILDKLTGVLHSVRPFCKNVALIIKGDRKGVSLYLAVRDEQNAQDGINTLKDVFLGNFPGSDIVRLDTKKKQKIFHLDFSIDTGISGMSVASLNSIPSKRGNQGFVQGLEKFIDAMRGKDYLCEILASPMNREDINEYLESLETLYTVLTPFQKKSVSFAESKSHTVTEGISRNISRSVSSGVNSSVGGSTGRSHSKNSGFNVGMHFLLNFGSANGSADTSSISNNINYGTNTQINIQTASGSTGSVSDTSGETKTVSMQFQSKGILNLLEKIEKNIARIKEGEAYGMWESAAWFIANNREEAAMAASAYRALVLGDTTGAENTHFNLFNGKWVDKIITALCNCVHPVFEIELGIKDVYGSNVMANVPAVSYINGKELALLFALPRKSAGGITITEMAEFGRSVICREKEGRKKISLGKIYHRGMEEESPVELDLESLTAHCFVTGSTGSGKSTAVYHLIEEISLKHDGIPFLVIEPAKGEYRDYFRKVKDIGLFTTNLRYDEMLKINPFSFPEGIHVLEHLDRLVEIFNTCWEMYAAMPAILKESMEEAYIAKGWDLTNSIWIGKGKPAFPTFADVLRQLPQLISSSDYSADAKGDYTGALVTRVKSLTNGIYGQIFCDNCEVENEILFDKPCIIDLSRVGSTETKSLLMGILILRLNEYRMASASYGNMPLRHITVLEEAHNILKNVQSASNAAGGSMVAKSVEMLTNSIAEMRTYGEGFIIVDQSPTSVDIAAIKNTNTKIIMRLPEMKDSTLAGHAVALKQGQIEEMPKLEQGIAVVMQSNWELPVLAKITRNEPIYIGQAEPVSIETLQAFRKAVITDILEQYVFKEERYADVEMLYHTIEMFDICMAKKREMRRFLKGLANKIDGAQGNDERQIMLGMALISLIGFSDSIKKTEKLLLAAEQTDDVWEEKCNEWRDCIENALKQYMGNLDDRYQQWLLYEILYAKCLEGSNQDMYRKLYETIVR